ncbi:MAG TPA: hypothetical protein DCL61_13680 [Cyanobacteria bacterium UBA12227]|nr:hypothetical protein [Cyanobacteria bacterium UBA12227]HAX89097.1 hypothetical protein [Cyanobacteria bacterium UBA11370]HBY76977.1 hypothetical protein [Cyanobacteria bacterium UBA11148]
MTELRHKSNRHIIKRIIVRGTLVLDTPTCLGSGDADSPTDLPLLRDSISNHALLTGSSIAGALRNYLRERKHGYMASEYADDLATLLFGGMRSDDDGNQSPLIIDDAISTQPIKAELRDGVKINSVTRTAEDKAKYDLELLQAGTEFTLSFELLIERDANKVDLLKALAIALSGLENQEICLGMKKRRGFGRCHVKEWQVWTFELTDTGDRMAWLLFERECSNKLPVITDKIADALGVVLEGEDKRDRFTLKATFQLVGSLLIRSGQDTPGRAPDVVHLKSHRNDELKSVLSGTSLAGVLRHRAERIVKTLGSCSPIVDKLFGYVVGKQSQASRLFVCETEIEEAKDLVQNRIAIDRFTGGAYHGALFGEQPIFGGKDTCVTIELELRKPEKYEIGLLLLLLKDLWTQDLPVGGESSIGRGRLQGKDANLTWYQWDDDKKSQWQEEWKIKQPDPKQPLQFSGSDKQKLEDFVSEFVTYIGKGEKP